MENEKSTTYTSPFDSGEWARWTNLERFNWLRAFRNQLEANRKQIEAGMKLDKKKVKRLNEAIKLLEAKLMEEMELTEKAVAYGEAIVELGMDALLSSKYERPISFPSFATPKRIDHKGN